LPLSCQNSFVITTHLVFGVLDAFFFLNHYPITRCTADAVGVQTRVYCPECEDGKHVPSHLWIQISGDTNMWWLLVPRIHCTQIFWGATLPSDGSSVVIAKCPLVHRMLICQHLSGRMQSHLQRLPTGSTNEKPKRLVRFRLCSTVLADTCPCLSTMPRHGRWRSVPTHQLCPLPPPVGTVHMDRCRHLELGCSFAGADFYVYCVAQAIIHKEVVPPGLTVGLSECQNRYGI
jgi:hypothetical protein